MTSPNCYKCALKVLHPWHDNGEEADIEHWSKGSTNGTPVYWLKENGYQ